MVSSAKHFHHGIFMLSTPTKNTYINKLSRLCIEQRNYLSGPLQCVSNQSGH